MPSSSSVRYVQPKAFALLTSKSLRGVPLGLVVSHKNEAFVTHNLGNNFCKFTYGQLFARTCINRFVATIVIHKKDTEICQVVNIEELAQRRTIAPTRLLPRENDESMQATHVNE